MINIITVYNSLNPGSFLQASALYNKIEQKYGKGSVSFYKVKARHPFLSSIKLSLKLLKKLKIKYSLEQLLMPYKYNQIIKKHLINTAIDNNSIFILGSDEIWNVSRDNISSYKIFWGQGLNLKRTFSYAPSINNTTIDNINNCDFIDTALNSMSAISVRDSYSKEILSNVTNKKIDIVCDPTLLHDVSYYKGIQKKTNKKDYIFVYGSPKRFSNEMINKIVEFAKANNKRIISYYFDNTWCDEMSFGSPYDFLGLIDGADYVFTNTFHGTIFSILYNKKFMAFDNENKKVSEILEQFNLKAYDSSTDFNQFFNNKIDYQRINDSIKTFRDHSEKYLFNSIDIILNNNL